MTTAPLSRAPFSARLGQSSAGRLDAIGRSLSKSYSFHISSQQPQQQQRSGEDGSLRVDSVPVDFTLKTKIRISSPSSLDWLANQDARIMSRSIEIFVGRQTLPSSAKLNDDESAALFRASLLSWTHPDTSIEESSAERRARWEQSFHSLYYMFRQGAADYFYVIAAKFTVLFANGIAIVSRSTSEIRKDLSANNVAFTMPLMKTRDLDEQLLLDIAEESALLIKGRRDLHMFFEYFINKKFLGDVPIMVSPVPFVNGVIRSLTPVFNQMTSIPTKTPASDGPKLVQTHVLEYSGILLPIQTGFLAQVLRQRIELPITIRFWTEPLTAAMDQIGGRDLADLATKHGFVALVDFAKQQLESDATLTITNLDYARTGRIAVEIDSAPKLSSLSRAMSSSKLI